ncbi:hypothetical protein GCM10009347_03970 [Shewanella algicola]|uniref:hypothetical protein n=1 Tax=Shewanella algicola TaxID=640633 RepID=UPI00166EC56B|nr:hypothetical protein [Shewanella algicola]GGP39294.1 hypothetical protein GCM10009347_03970 [Shewanella algicola]
MEKFAQPLIWLSQKVTGLLGKSDSHHYIRQELSAMNQMAKDSGEFSEQKSQILTQMLAMKNMTVSDIKLPRTVIFKLPTSVTNEQFMRQHLNNLSSG